VTTSGNRRGDRAPRKARLRDRSRVPANGGERRRSTVTPEVAGSSPLAPIFLSCLAQRAVATVGRQDAGAVERTRPEQGLSDDENGHDRGFERRERVTKESNPVQHCVINAHCCHLVELLVVAAKHCPVELTWIEACQVTLTVI
jgi:hypothetical protein